MGRSLAPLPAKANPESARIQSGKQSQHIATFGLLCSSRLRPGFVRMVSSEVEKPDLRVFVLVDVGGRSLVIGNVVERHAGSLLPESIPYKRQTGAIESRPDFLDVVMIHQVRLAHGERIERNGQTKVPFPQAVPGPE